jgi:BirA family biotin operon repressor/biotin-[acetyl-CoA-carboxylase] ligase
MKLIKLNAIDSTNEYIKKIKDSIKDKEIAVVTFNQTLGKGQMGKVWSSEPNKNVCMSFIFKELEINVIKNFKLNIIVSLLLVKVLKNLGLKALSVKWPNDILSDGKKLCGILIESSVKRTEITQSIIGIGLNVNQSYFGDLINATSIINLIKNHSDLDEISSKIISEFENFRNYLENSDYNKLKSDYLELLYGYKVEKKFRILGNVRKGEIIDVNSSGLLIVKIDEKKLEFKNQEIELIY